MMRPDSPKASKHWTEHYFKTSTHNEMMLSSEGRGVQRQDLSQLPRNLAE